MRHAWLARRLIDACGGLGASVRVCRVGRSRLSECQIAKSGAYLPADAIVDLEAYCGEPIYSREMMEARPHRVEADDLLTEACETTEAVAQLQALVRAASKDGKLSAAERLMIAGAVAAIEQQLRELRAAQEAAGGTP